MVAEGGFALDARESENGLQEFFQSCDGQHHHAVNPNLMGFATVQRLRAHETGITEELV
jgi:hypothetical protein